MSEESLEATIAALAADGFAPIQSAPSKPEIVIGARVHNRGEQYYSAYQDGTATVRAVMRKGTDEEPDAWERKYGRPNVEVVVERDDHTFTTWADYGTELAAVQPEGVAR